MADDKKQNAVEERKAVLGNEVAADSFACTYPGCTCPSFEGGGFFCTRAGCGHSDTYHV